MSANHKKNKNELIVSGPRYLLPYAGVDIDLIQNPFNQITFDKITQHQMDFLIPIFNDFLTEKIEVQHTENKIILDIHPCDELPLVGELGKLGRVFGATGFLGVKLSASVLCAKIMTDILLHQKSTDLHERLKPKRFWLPKK